MALLRQIGGNWQCRCVENGARPISGERGETRQCCLAKLPGSTNNIHHPELTGETMRTDSFGAALALTAIAALSSGCATLTGDRMQSISVETLDKSGAQSAGAACEMKNDEGKWFVTTPGSTVIKRSNKDLVISCKKDSVEDGNARAVSWTKAGMFGNIILGGGVGAIIDHNNGSAYEYPPVLQIVMGDNRVITSKTNPDGTPKTNVSKGASQANNAPQTGNSSQPPATPSADNASQANK